MASWTSSSSITALEAPLHGVCDLLISGHHDGSVTLAAFTASGIIPNPIRHAGRQDGKIILLSQTMLGDSHLPE